MEQAVIKIWHLGLVSSTLCFAALYKIVESKISITPRYIAYLTTALICEAILYAMRHGGNAWLTHIITPILLLLSARFLISLTPLKDRTIALPLIAIGLDILDNNFPKLDYVSGVFSYGVTAILSMVALCYVLSWRGGEVYVCFGMLIHNLAGVFVYPILPELYPMYIYLLTNTVMTISFIIYMGVLYARHRNSDCNVYRIGWTHSVHRPCNEKLLQKR